MSSKQEKQLRRYSCWLCGRGFSCEKKICLSCATPGAESIFEELDRKPNPYYVAFQEENDADELAFQEENDVDELASQKEMKLMKRHKL